MDDPITNKYAVQHCILFLYYHSVIRQHRYATAIHTYITASTSLLIKNNFCQGFQSRIAMRQNSFTELSRSYGKDIVWWLVAKILSERSYAFPPIECYNLSDGVIQCYSAQGHFFRRKNFHCTCVWQYWDTVCVGKMENSLYVDKMENSLYNSLWAPIGSQTYLHPWLWQGYPWLRQAQSESSKSPSQWSCLDLRWMDEWMNVYRHPPPKNVCPPKNKLANWGN